MVNFSVASRDVTARFLIEIRNNEFVPEPDPSDLLLPVRSRREIRGRIEILSGNLPPVAPEDELVPLVTNLCFGAVVTLLNERHAIVAYTDSYGYLRLDHEADMVRLSGDAVPDVRVLAQPLLAGLVDCGARFRTWLRSCHLEGDAEVLDRPLEEAEGKARRALAEAIWQ